MNIDAIKNGIVIDHIKAGKAMEIYKLLKLDSLECSVAIIKNAASGKMGKKDIIKIDSIMDIDLDALGYIDPNASVNIIKDGKLVEKTHLSIPEKLVNVLKCENPRCITSSERDIQHVFKLSDKKNHVYRCVYCESKPKHSKTV